MLENYVENWRDRDFVKEIQEEKGLNRADALAYLREHMPQEKYYQKKVMDGLKAAFPSAYVVKIAQGQFSTAGIPDVMCIVRGRYFGFEVKRPIFGKISPIQEMTIKKIWEAGGAATVVSYPEEAIGYICFTMSGSKE